MTLRAGLQQALPWLVAGMLVVLLKWETLSEPYVWDGLGGIAAPALDSLDHGFRLIRPERNFGHPPLLYLVLALVWKVAGPSVLVAHLLNLGFALLALFFTYRVARFAFGPRAALAAPVLTFFHSLFFAQSGLVNDSMALAALSAGVLWAFVERRALAWMALSCLLVLTKETGALLVAVLVCIHWGELVWNRQRPDRHALKLLGGAVVAAVVVGLWYLYQHQQLGFSLRTDLVSTEVDVGARLLRKLKRHLLHDGTSARSNGYNAVLLMAAVYGLARGTTQARRTILCCLAVVVAAIVLFTFTVDLPRYHAPYVPFLAVAASGALAEAAGSWRRLLWETAAVGGFIFLSVQDYRGKRSEPGFLLESNLEYQDMLAVHREVSTWLEENHRGERVYTVWPMSDELSDPRFGYVSRAVPQGWADGLSPGLYYLSEQSPGLRVEGLPQPVKRVYFVERNNKRAAVYRAGDSSRKAQGDVATVLVQRAVLALLGRPPSEEELVRLRPVLEQGGVKVLCQSLVETPEFAVSRRGLSPETLAESLYLAILGRTPEPNGRIATAAAIRSGLLASRAADMLTSAEFRERRLTPGP